MLLRDTRDAVDELPIDMRTELDRRAVRADKTRSPVTDPAAVCVAGRERDLALGRWNWSSGTRSTW